MNLKLLQKVKLMSSVNSVLFHLNYAFCTIHHEQKRVHLLQQRNWGTRYRLEQGSLTQTHNGQHGDK